MATPTSILLDTWTHPAYLPTNILGCIRLALTLEVIYDRMFRRSKGNVPQRPRQAKSASSVLLRENYLAESGNIESDALNQHPLTAANLAYERANRFASGNKEATKAEALQGLGPSETSKDQPGPERSQSVRFAGPNARPLMIRSITRREAPHSSASHESCPPAVPSRTTSYFPKGDSLMAQPGEFGESDMASMQSSYRKLRKAKSMFNPGRAPPAVFSGDAQKYKRHFKRHSWQSNTAPEEHSGVLTPRLQRSHSFLRGVTDCITSSNRQYATHDAAIQLARDTYLQQLEEQRLKQQPSFLNMGKRRKTQKPFRKTVRSHSTISYGTAIASPLASIEPAKASMGQKARSLSQTLKQKIQQVFKRSTNDQPPVPVQHLSASHAHYRDYTKSPNEHADDYSPVPEPDAELIRRVSSRETKHHDVPLYIDKSSRPGSIRSVSMHSDDDESNDRSRVTSWTNSTAADTITTVPQVVERKRLSIIKEDGGPYQPSSPSRKYGSLNDEHIKVRQSLRQKTADRVEAERVYSALQRKIDEDNRKAGFGDESKTDPKAERHRLQRTMSTPTRTSSRCRGVGSAPMPLTTETSIETTYPSYQQDYTEVLKGLTPQEIAEMNESGLLASRRPLREVKSAFFPPSMRIERSSTSPFRRMLKTRSEDDDSARANGDLDGQPRSSSRANLDVRPHNDSIAGSDSIYSRSPSGHTMTAVGSFLSLPGSESNYDAGTATIHRADPAKHRAFDKSPIGRRNSSADLSGTWRRFMADQVAFLEKLPPSNEQAYDVFSLREYGHKREDPQIDSDDVSIGQRQPSRNFPKQPLGVIHGNTLSQSPFKHRAIPSFGGDNASRRTSSFLYTNPTTQDENNPFDRRLSYPGKPSMAGSRRGLREEQPQVLLASQKDPRKAFNKADARHSPERVERLRRLKRSSSTSLLKISSQKENPTAADSCKSSYSLWQQGQDSNGSDTSPMEPGDNIVDTHKMVQSFLNGRRRDLGVSDESGTTPAFL